MYNQAMEESMLMKIKEDKKFNHNITDRPICKCFIAMKTLPWSVKGY